MSGVFGAGYFGQYGLQDTSTVELAAEITGSSTVTATLSAEVVDQSVFRRWSGGARVSRSIPLTRKKPEFVDSAARIHGKTTVVLMPAISSTFSVGLGGRTSVQIMPSIGVPLSVKAAGAMRMGMSLAPRSSMSSAMRGGISQVSASPAIHESLPVELLAFL